MDFCLFVLLGVSAGKTVNIDNIKLRHDFNLDYQIVFEVLPREKSMGSKRTKVISMQVLEK